MAGRLQGYLDEISEDGWVSGWALMVDDTSRPVALEVLVNGRSVGAATADQFRQDLSDASFANPSCAFWFKLPDDVFDEGEYRIAVKVAGDGRELHNSPQIIQVGSITPNARAQATNLLVSGDFLHWPSGIAVAANGPGAEVARGWSVHVDDRRPVAVTAALAKPVGMGLADDEAALRLSVTPAADEVRLVAAVALRPATCLGYHFSCSLRRPARDVGGGLSLRAVELLIVDGGRLLPVATVHGPVAIAGTVRLADVALTLDPEALAGHSADARFAVALVLSGSGDVVVARPWLGLPLRARVATDRPGAFEDANISGQLDVLKLSPIWQSDARARPALAAPAPPRPVEISFGPPRETRLPFVQIVVPVFNAAGDVADLVASLLQDAASPIEIVIADDGSAPGVGALAQSWRLQDPRIRYLGHADNVGYTRNINIALQATVADYVVLINSDTVVGPRWLERMMAAMLADVSVGAVGPLSNAASWQSVPLVKGADGGWAVNVLPAGLTVAGMADHVARASERAHPQVPLLNGFCTLFRRAALDDVGYFDDEHFPAGYGEENDLCIRLGRAGWSLKVADDAYVFHKKSRSFGPEMRNELSAQSSRILNAKYPELVIASLEEAMRTCDPINRLRRSLATSLRTAEDAAPSPRPTPLV